MTFDAARPENMAGRVSDSGTAGRSRPTSSTAAVDREVPLARVADRELPSVVHAWLDGALPEATLRREQGDMGRDIEFWRQLNGEVERRRRLRTPTYLEARIMAALPRTVPQPIAPWWRRAFVATPAGAALAVGALVLVSAAVTALAVVALR